MNHTRWNGWRTGAIASMLWLAANPARAGLNFPRPEFETGYVYPPMTTPPAGAAFLQALDVALLAAALSVGAYLALRRRSRRGMFWLTVVCLAYFGFWRDGCICPIGSIQNVTLGLTDSGYAVPLAVLLFFLLPLVFALLFGRVFCAGVCPLGAIQDLVALKPVKVPRGINEALGLLPYLYLGASVLYVVTGTGFMICRYDPFVGFFRMSGSLGMLLYGGALLVIGIFVARPYCRYLCPYSVLLNWSSRFAWRHASISPDHCIQCTLCEHACPFDCIRKPTPPRYGERLEAGTRRLARTVIALPVLVIAFAALGVWSHEALARADRTVKLAEQVARENRGLTTTTTLDSETFRDSGGDRAELDAEAAALRAKFRLGGGLLGVFMGLVVGGKLVAWSIRRRRVDYELDRATCFSCARCFKSCPREQLRLGLPLQREPFSR
jgi:NosR/NirI family transcriptional regulator, nitrous oxide reductase regulator